MVGAQSADVYQQLLRLYHDQPALAAQAVAKPPVMRLAAVFRCAGTGRCSLQQLRAGAMLHADAADLVSGPVRLQGTREQIRFGREMLEIAGNVALNNKALNNELKALRVLAAGGTP